MALSGSPSTSVVNASQAAYVSSSDSAHPTSNTAATVTYAAVTGQFHVLGQIIASLDSDPAAAVNLKVEDVSGTTIFSIDLPAAKGVYAITFNPAKQAQASGTAMIITLAAPGSGVTGKVNCTHWTVTS